MKADQVLRFRESNQGIGILGQTQGVTDAIQKALENHFNDALLSFFPNMGDSSLTCVYDSQCGFVARNTLRTNEGRAALLTHAYVLNVKDYANTMEQTPLTLLSIPMSNLLDFASGTVLLEPIDLKVQQASPEFLDSLLEKYHLKDPRRYSHLLMGAYEAMTSGNTTLQLKTDCPMAEAEQIVRELSYCILQGLIPRLRHRFSFTSSANPSLRISVASAGQRPTAPLVFGVEDDRYTNIYPQNDLAETVFLELAQADAQARQSILSDMQCWLEEVVDLDQEIPINMIYIAFYLREDRDLPMKTLQNLFKYVSKSRGLSPYVVNGLLTDLVQRMNAQEHFSVAGTSMIAERYLTIDSSAFRKAADEYLSRATPDICTDLVNVIFQQNLPSGPARTQLLQNILLRIPTSPSPLAPNVQAHVLVWILSENLQKLTGYALALLDSYTPEQMYQVAEGILGREGNISNLQMDVLTRCLSGLVRNHAIHVVLSETAVRNLERLSKNASQSLLEASADYLLQVRLESMNAESGLQLLETYRTAFPKLFSQLTQQIIITKQHLEIWELYQAKHILGNCTTREQMRKACLDYHIFEPLGPFEQTIEKQLLSLFHKDLEYCLQTKTTLRALITDNTRDMLDAITNMRISVSAKGTIRESILNALWEQVSSALIVKNKWPPESDFFGTSELAQQKRYLLDTALEIRRNPYQFRDLIAKSKDLSFPRDFYCSFCANMALELISDPDTRFVSWDLVLLGSLKADADEPEIFSERLLKVCQEVDKRIQNAKYSGQPRFQEHKKLQLRKESWVRLPRPAEEHPQAYHILYNTVHSEKKLLGFLPLSSSSPADKAPSIQDLHRDDRSSKGRVRQEGNRPVTSSSSFRKSDYADPNSKKSTGGKRK